MANDTAFKIPRGQRQLFLDDQDVAGVENLTRTMHRPDKKGAVIRPDLINEGAPQIRTGPAYDPDEGLYKLWTLVATDKVMAATALHTSRDGVHWTQPNVGLVEVNGSRDNNLVAYPFANGTVGPNSIIYDPFETDPQRRYKSMAYYRPTHVMSLATSPDGVHWTGEETTLPSYDEFNLSYDATDRKCIATLKVRGPYGRSHALATSQDFRTWTTPELVFHADEQDQALAKEVIARHIANPSLQPTVTVHEEEWATDVYNFAASRYEGMYIGFAAFFYHVGRSPLGTNHDGFHLIQLACSRDLKTWTRLGNREAFIGSSPLGAGAYDTLQILPPSFPILRGNDLWFYYSGLRYRVAPAKPLRDWAAICLATLRRDGFISLDAGDADGTVTTQPFEWDGETLYVNADASDGHLQVEALDATGSPIGGYGRADSTVVSEDSLRAAISWQGAALRSRGPVRLRFHLNNAKLYSYWFE